MYTIPVVPRTRVATTELAGIIRLHRRLNRLRQSDVARVLNVSQMTVSRIETGDAVPKLEWMRALAHLLGVPMAELVAAYDRDERRRSRFDEAAAS